MNEPPNSRYFAPARSGQPSVWMMRRSGLGTRQTSLTPSAQTCGFSPARPNRSSAAPVRWPCVPSARTVTRATTSEPGSKFASSSRCLPRPLSPGKQPRQRGGVDDGAREQVRAGLLPLLAHGTRPLAQPLGDEGGGFEQLSEPDRASEPRRAGPDHRHPDLDPLLLGVGGRRDRLAQVERRRKVRRPGHARRRRTSSVSFGTISWRSPTTPRSAYSKIGAFGSLLIATTTFDPCMPTLCWIAPEMPTPM